MNLSRHSDYSSPFLSCSTEVDHQTSLLHAVLESTADGLLVIDREGRMILYNTKFVQLWNMPIEILTSKNDNEALRFVLSQLVHPEAFVQKVSELYNNPEFESYDILEFKDGRVCERYSQPHRLGGEIIGRVWSFRDVTENKKAERALIAAKLELESMMESISDYVWAASIEGEGQLKYHFFSTPVEKITGRPASFYLKGIESWLSTVHPEDQNLVSSALHRLKNGESQHESAEYRIQHPDGRIVFIRDSVNARKLANGTIRLDGISSDITHQKFAEKQRQDLLESESRARHGAEKDVQDRDLFISIASHELKNPLSNLQLRIEILNQSVEKTDPSSPLKDQLTGCRKSVETFKQLINELLDLSKIRAGGCVLQKTAFNFSELVNEILLQFADDFRNRNCPLTTTLDPTLVGSWDETKIGQVLTNLISNTLKYAAGRSVEVRTYAKDNSVVFEIKDQGVGISRNDLDKLFQPYSRLDGEAASTGLGLGLYISKQYIEAHCGSIAVESQKGLGSLFRVILPLEAED